MTKKFLTVKDLAALFNLKESWVYDRTSRNGPEVIPHVRFGRQVRFDVESEEFQAWLRSHGVFAQPKHLTFEAFASGLWLTYRKNQGFKGSTNYGHQSILRNHVLPELGPKELEIITPADMTMFSPAKVPLQETADLDTRTGRQGAWRDTSAVECILLVLGADDGPDWRDLSPAAERHRSAGATDHVREEYLERPDAGFNEDR